MERVCALALCLLISLCSATSPPKNPNLIPLNCNETNHAGLAADLINEDRDHGFVIKPFRVKSFYEQKVASVAGSSLYYINFEVKETACSVLSHKKWKDCTEEVPYHERVFGECKSIIYISKPWRVLKLLTYNCTLGTVPSSSVVSTCPDCPSITGITEKVKAKADLMVQQFNIESNQTNHFKIDEIERVRTQWVFGESLFILFTIKETVCKKALKSIVKLENCKSLEDSKAHVGFCNGNSYFKPNQIEEFSVTCEIYNPQPDDDQHHHHHHHKHGTCDHGKEGDQAKESTDNAGQGEGAGKAAGEAEAAAGEAGAGEAAAGEAGAGEAGAGEAGAGEAAAGEAGAGEAGADGAQEKCELGKGKRCGHHRGHKHHCHPGHHHHRHHHHPRHHHHHHHPGHHHHGSSEEITDKQPFKSSQGSFQVYYPIYETTSIPAPTIQPLPKSEKQTEEASDFPDGPSPLDTCPGQQMSESS